MAAILLIVVFLNEFGSASSYYPDVVPFFLVPNPNFPSFRLKPLSLFHVYDSLLTQKIQIFQPSPMLGNAAP